MSAAPASASAGDARRSFERVAWDGVFWPINHLHNGRCLYSDPDVRGPLTDADGNCGIICPILAIASAIAALSSHDPIIHAIAAIAIGFVFSPAGNFFIAALGPVGNALLGGFIVGGVTSHTLQGALLGGLQGLAFAGVGALGLNYPERILANGLSGAWSLRPRAASLAQVSWQQASVKPQGP